MLEEGDGHGQVKLEVKAWETYRGNDWDNKGEEAPRQKLSNAGDNNGVVFGAKVLGEKGYFMERGKCEFCCWHTEKGGGRGGRVA